MAPERMFAGVVAAPPDPILGLTEAWKDDPRPGKVNLGVGVYQDDHGRTPVLESVRAAATALVAAEDTKAYLPIPGDPTYGRLVQDLLFPDRPILAENRLRTAHTPGGTGALRLGAELVADLGRRAGAWVSVPSWANHRQIFAAAGFALREYPYYDPATRGVARDRLLETLAQIPAGDVVVLHVACHNPTGADPDASLWRDIAVAAARAGWLPFLDAAYLGFGDGLVEDRAPLDAFVEAGVDFLVATSFSKNMGLYCERVGALTLAAAGPSEADAVFSRLKKVIRVIYSNPPAHGGRVARRLLEDRLLRDVWLRELTVMRARIHRTRAALAESLGARVAGRDFGFIRRQRGIFSYSGLTAGQVAWLQRERAIYMTADGRINVAGLNDGNLPGVADAIAEALRGA